MFCYICAKYYLIPKLSQGARCTKFEHVFIKNYILDAERLVYLFLKKIV